MIIFAFWSVGWSQLASICVVTKCTFFYCRITSDYNAATNEDSLLNLECCVLLLSTVHCVYLTIHPLYIAPDLTVVSILISNIAYFLSVLVFSVHFELC